MTTVFPVDQPAALGIIVFGSIGAMVVFGALLAGVSLLIKKEKRIKMLSVGIVLLVAGAGLFFFTNPDQKDSVTVGQGSVLASSSYFNLNITRAQISKAYVVNFSDWNVSVASKTDGSSLGSYRAGYFTLSNGARADMLTASNTNLVLVLDSGTYVILGPNDFPPFISAFDQSVTQPSAG